MTQTLLIPLFHSYPGQRQEQERVATALAIEGISVAYWEEGADRMPAADAVCWQGISGYHKDLPRLRSLLRLVKESGLLSINSLALTEWNIDKRYLRELELAGVPIIPTVWIQGDGVAVCEAARQADLQEVVVKPVVSAGAFQTFRILTGESWPEIPQGEWMVQPFLPEILSDGEWSLLYFGGAFSHCVRKRAKAGDYRIQHTHGGWYERVDPPEWLRHQADAVMTALPEAPVYARIDGVVRDGTFLLMEVELIEPYLYLDAAPEQAAVYAAAIAAWMPKVRAA